MFRGCLMARVRGRWCAVQTPVSRRGTILPRSATKPCSSRTSRYGIASIFSVQNLQTFLRRKNFPRPPGPLEGRPPGPLEGRPPERGPPEPEPEPEPELGPEFEPCPDSDPELPWDADAPASGAFPGVSSDMMFPLHSL